MNYTIPPNGWLVVCLGINAYRIVLPCVREDGTVHAENTLNILANMIGDLHREADARGKGPHVQVFELGHEVKVKLDYRIVSLVQMIKET